MNRMTIPAVAAALGLALAAGSAGAKTWDFSFTDAVNNTGSGQFITGNAGSPYTVTSVTGQVDGVTIGAMSPYADSDQLLYSAAPYVNVLGISFDTVDAHDNVLDQYNIYEWMSGDHPGTWLLDAAVDPNGYGWNGNPMTSFTLTAVPEPGSWSLMIIGVGLAGAALRRRAANAVAA